MTTAEQEFTSWLTTHGTSICSDVAFSSFEGMGRGLIATADIQPDTVIFSLPRSLLVTTTTSLLPTLLPADGWSELGGWSPLILIMMYERSRPANPSAFPPSWAPYFALLPSPESFNSLMFWSDEELSELEGSTVKAKVGREEAEEEWRDNVWPFVLKHKEVLAPAGGDEVFLKANFGMDMFHYCGTLILSRSFHVETGTGGDDSDEEDSDDEEEEKEDVGDVAMVPMADILNAKSGCDNARLFYEPLTLNMMSTSFIPAGSQIFNTYADPPNADLLRRYGHVDDDNAADEVEIGLETIVEMFVEAHHTTEEEGEARAEWLLEAGLDDTFSIPTSAELSPEIIATIRTFLMSAAELDKQKKKDTPPRPKMDVEVATWAVKLLERRAASYKTSIKEDEKLMANPTELPLRKKMAIQVRLGEKRILQAAKEGIEEFLKEEVKEAASAGKKDKAKRSRDDVKGSGKGAKKAKGN
ncbi:N-lysine methyltransferase SETD6, partial [Phenoliferia sp. Uapishka_3]